MCEDCNRPGPQRSHPGRRAVLKGAGGLGLTALSGGLGGLVLGATPAFAAPASAAPGSAAPAPDPALLTRTPTILPRSAWAGTSCPVRGPLPAERPGDVKFLLVHHTEVPGNDYTRDQVAGLLRGMYAFHTGPEKGWSDLAYNFVVDRYGRIWEGRTGSLSSPVVPAATGGTQGFDQLGCFLGDHQTVAPTAQAQASMISLLAWLARRYDVDPRPGTTVSFVSRGSNRWPAGTTVTTRTIEGHRSMSLTACPGDAAYPLVRTVFPAAVTALAARPLAGTERGAWSSSDGTVDLAERRADGSVAVRVLTASGLSEPELLGGRVVGAPAVLRRPSGVLEVYARGRDDVLHVKRRRLSGSWTGWSPLDGAITGPPAVALTGQGEVHLFARGATGALLHRASPEPGVYAPAWDDLGGRLRAETGPGAVWSPAGGLEVVVQGTNAAVYRTTYAGAPSGFSRLGGTAVGSPAAAAPGGALLVVVAGTRGRPYARTTTTGWSLLGGRIVGSPVVAAAPGTDRAVVLATGSDGALLRGTWTAGLWSGWSRA